MVFAILKQSVTGGAESGAYRSSALIEVFAAHQQIVVKTDDFYGYPTGAMSLCATAMCLY